MSQVFRFFFQVPKLSVWSQSQSTHQLQFFLLDIVVEPNRQWRWKDEDELALAIERGRLTVEQAQEVRREGEAAVTDIEAFRSPFCDGWERWRPGPELQMPILSPAWNDVSMYDTTD